MLFYTKEFILLFLPITLILYYLTLNITYVKILLIFLSLVFYSCGI